ncbi:MAG: helix-turn-helix domain-containing protein [Oscillospiraceae bacterium]|nr:helix-turn-helix domain-containing protein [Oscillospiraceae bacterium]
MKNHELTSQKNDVKFVQKRIASLKVRKGVSGSKMSLELGHTKNYISNIINGNALPSIPQLFAICEYFGINQMEFFDIRSKHPSLVSEVFDIIRDFNANDMKKLLKFAKKIKVET